MIVLDKIRNDIFFWTEKRRSKWGRYGRFRFAKSSGKSCLSGALIALLDIYDYFEILETLSLKQKIQWVEYIQSFQDKTSGLFIDKKNRRGISVVDWNAVAEYDTARSIDALSVLGSSCLYSIIKNENQENKKLFSADALYNWIQELDWNKWPAGAATALQQIVAILQETRPEDLEKMIEMVKQFMHSTQNMETGLWGGKDATLEQRCSSAYKMIIIFGELGVDIPNREKILKTALHWFFDFEQANMCAFRNSLCLVVETLVSRGGEPIRMKNPKTFKEGISKAIAKGSYTKDDNLILSIVRHALEMIKRFKAPDLGYSFYPGRATSHHNGVILCKGLQEGDFLAASNVAFCHACISLLISMLSEKALAELQSV